jgi:hypothetical protein
MLKPEGPLHCRRLLKKKQWNLPSETSEPGTSFDAMRTFRCDRAVVVLQDRFLVSKRRACRLACYHRNIRRRPVLLADTEEQMPSPWICELARRHVRCGRALVYWRLRLNGWSVNHKRVQPGLPKSMNQVVAPAIVTPPSASIPLMS